MLMATDREKRHDKLVAFIKELSAIAPAFKWSVAKDGKILGRYIECERVKPFGPVAAVAFFGTERMEHDAHVAAGKCHWEDIVWELERACEHRKDSVLRDAVLDAVGLKGER